MTQPKPDEMKMPRGKPPKDPKLRKAWEAKREAVRKLRESQQVKGGLPVVRRGQPPKDPLERKAWEEHNAVARELKKSGITLLGGKKTGSFSATPVVDENTETDAQILARHKETDAMLRDMLHSVAKGDIRALIVSGGPGIGKTVTSTEIFNYYRSKNPNFRYRKLSGKVSAVMLYKLAYKYRHPGDRLLVDDADALLFTEDGLNLLKALLDTLAEREPSWNTNTALVGEDGEEIPRSGWVYEGGIVFNTNLDMDRIINGPPSKISDHLRAVVNRSIYFNMRMHLPRELFIWTKYMCESKGILIGPPSYLNKKQEQMALAWMHAHMNEMREISLRSAMHVAKFIAKHTAKWEALAARTLLLKPGQRRELIPISA